MLTLCETDDADKSKIMLNRSSFATGVWEDVRLTLLFVCDADLS